MSDFSNIPTYVFGQGHITISAGTHDAVPCIALDWTAEAGDIHAPAVTVKEDATLSDDASVLVFPTLADYDRFIGTLTTFRSTLFAKEQE